MRLAVKVAEGCVGSFVLAVRLGELEECIYITVVKIGAFGGPVVAEGGVTILAHGLDYDAIQEPPS
jgi:hypothetical protein